MIPAREAVESIRGQLLQLVGGEQDNEGLMRSVALCLDRHRMLTTGPRTPVLRKQIDRAWNDATKLLESLERMHARSHLAFGDARLMDLRDVLRALLQERRQKRRGRPADDARLQTVRALVHVFEAAGGPSDNLLPFVKLVFSLTEDPTSEKQLRNDVRACPCLDELPTVEEWLREKNRG